MNQTLNIMSYTKKGFLICVFCISLHFSGFSQIAPEFNPIPTSFNVDSPYPVYALDIAYDSTDMNAQRFHLFLPDSVGSFPLVIYIHGGGYISNSPDIVLSSAERMQDIKFCLENGIAYASIGYRLINNNGPDNEGVIKCLNDAKRGLQFIRYYSEDLQIDPTKIALQGSSAGASSSYWLGVRSDMADASSENPIDRKTTRVCAVFMSGPQASLDFYKWETHVFQNFDGNGTNYTLDSMENLMGFDRASNFYGGLDSIQQILVDAALIQYRLDVDQLSHFSADDPPMFVSSQSNAQHPGQDLFHHAYHGREIQNTALSAGILEIKANIPLLNINTTDSETGMQFLVRHLNDCSITTSLNDLSSADDNISIFPNPVDDRFSLRGKSKQYHVEILDALGQVKDNLGKISSDTPVDISWLPNGIYFLRLEDKSSKQVELLKFIKM